MRRNGPTNVRVYSISGIWASTALNNVTRTFCTLTQDDLTLKEDSNYIYERLISSFRSCKTINSYKLFRSHIFLQRYFIEKYVKENNSKVNDYYCIKKEKTKNKSQKRELIIIYIKIIVNEMRNRNVSLTKKNFL